jgi:endonuclease YncB( thermonuclease family)
MIVGLALTLTATAQDLAQTPEDDFARQIEPGADPDAGLSLIDREIVAARLVEVERADRLVVSRYGERISIQLSSIASPDRESTVGAEAAAFVEERLADEDLLVALRGADAGDRTLGRVRIGLADDAPDLALELVRRGLAAHCGGPLEDSLLEQAQEGARDAGVGIWAGPADTASPCGR